MINTMRDVLQLADNMASAASQMGMMGYEALITNREMLVERLTEVYKVLEQFTKPKD